jgi:hypothetical protein
LLRSFSATRFKPFKGRIAIHNLLWNNHSNYGRELVQKDFEAVARLEIVEQDLHWNPRSREDWGAP